MNTPLPHLDEHRCADLVLGLLPASVRGEALDHLSHCPECEQRLRAHAGARVAGLLGAPAASSRLLRLPVRPRQRWIALGAAAAAAVLAVFLARDARPPQVTRATAWLPDAGELVLVRAGGGHDPALAEGLAAYGRRDVPRAIAMLRAARVEGASEQVRRLYLGHALIAAAQPREALAWLASVELARLPEPWRTDAERALVLAWRANGQHRQADSLERAQGR